MIKNIKESLIRIEKMPYVINGNSYHAKKYKNKTLKEIYEEIDETQLKPQTNPFFEKNKEQYSEIQQYFNDRYFFIDEFVKKIIQKLSKNGEIRNFINDSIINYSAIIARYNYDGTFPNDNNKYFIIIEKNKKILKIKGKNSLTSIEFKKSNIFKIEQNTDNEIKTIYFKKPDIFSTILNIDKNIVKKYEKISSNGYLESVEYDKKLNPEKYSLLKNRKKYKEIIFDTTDYSNYLTTDKKIIPLEFLSYDLESENLIKDVIYQYSKPYKFIEFDSNTGKQITTFLVQGINNFVYKYMFYSSITGQLILSGNL